MGDAEKAGANNGSDRVELLIRLLKIASFVSTPMRDGVCEPAGVSSNELRVIMALAGEGELAGHDLVEIMGVPPMNVSRAIADLRHKGWVELTTDPDNRRRKPARLTPAGHAAYAAMMPDIAKVADALLGKLTLRRQREFAVIADLLIDRMANWIVEHHQDVKMPSDLG